MNDYNSAQSYQYYPIPPSMPQVSPQLASQYPYLNRFSQPMPQQAQVQQITNFLKGRPVSGVDEARASQIDLDGSLHIFTDAPNGKIYTKRILMNGSSEFNVYSIVVEPAPVPVQTTEINKVQQQLVAGDAKDPDILLMKATITNLQKQIAALEEKIESFGGVMNATVRSDTAVPHASKQRKSSSDASTDGQ